VEITTWLGLSLYRQTPGSMALAGVTVSSIARAMAE